MTGTNGNGNGNGARVGTDRVKQGLAQMLKGGVIVSLSNSFLPHDGTALTSVRRGEFGTSCFCSCAQGLIDVSIETGNMPSWIMEGIGSMMREFFLKRTAKGHTIVRVQSCCAFVLKTQSNLTFVLSHLNNFLFLQPFNYLTMATVTFEKHFVSGSGSKLMGQRFLCRRDRW